MVQKRVPLAFQRGKVDNFWTCGSKDKISLVSIAQTVLETNLTVLVVLELLIMKCVNWMYFDIVYVILCVLEVSKEVDSEEELRQELAKRRSKGPIIHNP